jgi:hypothetical protein
MYVSRRIAAAAAVPPFDEPPLERAGGAPGGGGAAVGRPGGGGGARGGGGAGGESNAEIVRSVREALASYDDPTVMAALQKELAIKEERFEDARWAGWGGGLGAACAARPGEGQSALGPLGAASCMEPWDQRL